MTSNTIIRAIAKETGFTETDVCKVLKSLSDLLNSGDALTPATRNQEVDRFWQCFNWARKKGTLVQDVDFRNLRDEVAIRWGAVYRAYQEGHRHLFGREGNSNTYTMTLLRGSPAFVIMLPSLRIGETRTSAWVFRIAQLPITL